MPVGAIIGGAVATVGGSAISSGAAGRAADRASDATLQAAKESAAVQRDIYGQNKNALTPFMNTGTAAMGQVNALLGIPSTGGSGSSANWGGYLDANPDVMAGYYDTADRAKFATPEEYGQWHYGTYGQQEGRQLGSNALGGGQQAAEDAFARYRDSTGYQFRLGEGFDAVKSGYAGRGMVQSGAALKSLNDYGQGMASQEFGNYLNALGNQQGVGLSGASALAGVGQNYANSLGNIYQQSGANQANAALARGQSGAQFGNALAGVGSQALGYGLKPPTGSGGSDAWYSPIAGGYR